MTCLDIACADAEGLNYSWWEDNSNTEAILTENKIDDVPQQKVENFHKTTNHGKNDLLYLIL